MHGCGVGVSRADGRLNPNSCDMIDNSRLVYLLKFTGSEQENQVRPFVPRRSLW